MNFKQWLTEDELGSAMWPTPADDPELNGALSSISLPKKDVQRPKGPKYKTRKYKKIAKLFGKKV